MKSWSDIPIGEILLQQPPFRFVDRLEFFSVEETRVSFTVGDTMMMEGDRLSAAGLMEHMAQASAARIGYYSRFELNIPIEIGFIGQIRKFSYTRLPVKGERLETSVLLRQEVFRISLCDILVSCNGEVIASASLKTALKDD